MRENLDIEKLWNDVDALITTHISEPRASKLKSMYEKLAEKLMTAPASSHADRHNCFAGGYIDHIVRVTNNAIKLYDFWTQAGANTSTYSLEEVVFSALNHDLGKIGTDEFDYYVPNDSSWHRERGQIYKLNPQIHYMKVPDRSIYMLQKHGVPVTEQEYLAIKLHDGMYAKGNEGYFMTVSADLALKTTLPLLLHHADHLSTLVEENMQHGTKTTTTKVKSPVNKVNNPVADANLKNIFDDLFGNAI